LFHLYDLQTLKSSKCIIGPVLTSPLCCLLLLAALQCPALSRSKELDPRNSVVFLYDSPVDDLPSATGFMAGFNSADKNNPGVAAFLITNKHVIAGKHSMCLRFNPKDAGPVHYFQLNLDQAQVIPSQRPEVDLAAIAMPTVPEDWYEFFDLSSMLSDDQMNSLHITEGADVYTIAWNIGMQKSVVVARQPRPLRSILRFGKISLLTKEFWDGLNDPTMVAQAYLVDMQASPAWHSSGSPLLLQTPRLRDHHLSHRGNKQLLIGVNKGYMSGFLPVQYAKLGPSATETNSAYVDMPGELIITEPVANLRELLEVIGHDLIKSGRKIIMNQDQDYRKNASATQPHGHGAIAGDTKQ
jgi:hypothetical protein